MTTAGSAVAEVPLDAAPVITADNIYTSGETINLGSVTIPRTTDLLSSMSAAASDVPILAAIWRPFGTILMILICGGINGCAHSSGQG
ncbi:hypothetical protein ACFVUS_12285 [Nocardia sp. NPDC058058]|uniref:hypothetical protein n=1 Tax=Nocardia sp. NPDC058058 TaxID=3346317 RepID=UPI0036DB7C84